MDRYKQIIVNCRDCGQTRVTIDEVTVRQCLDDEQWSYRFRCEECGRPTVEPTSESRARDALELGVALEVWRYPAELLEPHAGPPLELDDLLEFHRALDTPGWFESLARTSGD